MGIPLSMLPEIRSSSEVYGTVASRRHGPGRARSPASSATSRRPRSGRPASRSARPRTPTAPATSCCSTPARSRSPSKNGLLTTVCYKIGDQPTVYALEGSIAVTGSLVQWLRDNLGMISSAPEIEELAKTVDDNGGAYFVPAFSGPVRAVLAFRRPRRARRPHPVRQQGPHRPGRAGGDGVPDPRGAGRHERRLRRRPDRAQGRRRHGRQRAAHAVPGRHPRRPRGPAAGRGDHGARRGLRGRPRRRLLERRAGRHRQLGRGQALGAADGRRRARPAVPALEEGRHQDLRLGRRRRESDPA